MVTLEAIIDNSSLTKAQKEIAKKKIQIDAEIDTKRFTKSKNDLEKRTKELANHMKSMLGDMKIDISDKDAMRYATQYYKSMEQGAKKAQAEQIKLNELQQKSKLADQSKYYNKIIDNNKQIYAMKQKLITADEKETAELQRQIKNATERNRTAKNMINKHDLYDSGYAKQVKDSERLLQNQLKLASAKAQDKVATRAATAESKKYVDTFKVNKLSNNIKNWLAKNTAATEKAKLEMQSYLRTLDSGKVTPEVFATVQKGLGDTDTKMRETGKLGSNLTSSLKSGMKSFVQWTLASGGVMAVVGGMREMYQAVTDINKATVELKKVSDASDNELAKYYDDATESAKKYGASIADVISNTADYSRLGYDLSSASQLSDATTLMQKIGDNMTQESSSDGMISTLRGFQLEADKAKEIVDTVNEVANTEPIDTSEIFEGLERSASSLYTAGNTYREAIALLSAGTSVTRDAEAMGTSLKTVSLRLTSTSAQLQEMGEDTEYACETMSDYRDLVMGLTHNKVDILGDNGQYKNTYNILKDISGVFDEMNSMEQSSLLKSLFGVRQANAGAAILQNFDIAEASLKSAQNSDGSAERELENWNQGIEAHVARAKESFEELANDTISTDLIKDVVDVGSGLLQFLDALISKVGLLTPLLGGLGIGAFIKNFA